MGYIISLIDKNEVRRNRRRNIGGSGGQGRYDSWTDQDGDFRDQTIGDDDDFMKLRKKYLVWTEELNFIMNGKGQIITGEEVGSPIPGVLPIVDISIEKDFEYWVRQGDSLTEFTIEHNELMSFISQVVLMEGFSQAFLIAKDDVIPQNIQIGPNFLLKLPVEEGSSVRPEFGYASPGADISSSISFAESKLAQFLTSRGIDPATVSGKGQSDSATSGIDRLLKQIQMFEASRQDFDTYQKAEKEIYKVIKAWHNALIGTGLLDPEFQAAALPEDSEVFVKFAGPEMVQTQNDKIDVWMKRIEAGEATVVDMMMDLRDVDKETALELLDENRELEEKIVGVQLNQAIEQAKDAVPESDNPEQPAQPKATSEAEERKRVALNGAQVTAILTIVKDVASGNLPREAAINLIMTSFNLSREEAEAVLGDAGRGFTIEET